MISIALLTILLTFSCYYFLWKPKLYWRNKNVKQRTPIPILGDSITTALKLESRTDFLLRIYNTFKDARYFGIYQASLPTLVIRDPDLIKQLQIKYFDHFMDHQNFGIDAFEPIWNKNLISLKGQKWRDMRTTLSPTFTASKMRIMFELIDKSAKQYVNFYLQKNEVQIELELKDSFARFATDVIATCAFGLEIDSLKYPTNDFYMQGRKATNFTGFWKGIKFIIMLVFPKVAKFLKLSIFAPDTLNYFRELISSAIKLREEKNIVRPDMIHIMIQARKGQGLVDEGANSSAGFSAVEETKINSPINPKYVSITDEDMTAQVLVFFFAGYSTVSTLISFLCYELAINTDIQLKLRDEINEVDKATGGKLTYEKLNGMKYLDMIVSEGLRKFPPAPVTDRLCTKPFTIQPERSDESPVVVDVGQLLWFPLYGIHRDEEHFPNPDKFDPERFAEDRIGNIKPYTFMPFGVGQRNCIGSRFALMEVKVLFYYLFHNFELTVIKKTCIPLKYDRMNKAPALAGGFWIGYKRIQPV